MSFEMNADVFDSLQSASLTVACYADDEEIFIYLGEDDYVDVSADGKVRSNFNGKWPALKEVPLPVEIIDSTGEYEILGSIPCSNIVDTLVRNALNLKIEDKPLYDGNYVQNISFKDIQPDASTVK